MTDKTGRAQVLRTMLRERDLRFLLSAQFLAQAGDGLAQAVFADVLVLEPLNQGTPGRIFALFALTLLPYSAISPFLGVFVDRWERRKILFWSNASRGVLLLTLFLWAPLLPGNGGLFAATLTLLGLGRLFLTTKGAVLPVLLHEHHLLAGNSVSGGGGMLAALAGAVLGIGLILAIPASAAFAIAGVLYIAGASFARLIAQPMSHRRGEHVPLRAALISVARDLFEGVAGIWKRPAARLPLLSIFLQRTLTMFVVVSAILIIKEAFPGEARVGRLSSSALALGAAGVGAFVGALTASRLGKRLHRGGLILFGFAVSSAAIISLGGILDIYAISALTFIGGYGGFVTKVAVDASVQDALPDELRGRAFALYDILYNLASVAAAGVMVTAYDLDEPEDLRGLLIASGVIGLLVTAALTRAFKSAGLPVSRAELATDGGNL